VPLLRARHLTALALLAGAFLTRRDRSPRGRRGAAWELLALAAGLLWAFPEGAGLAAVLRDAAVLAGGAAGVVAAAAAGLAVAAAIGGAAALLLRRSGAGAALPPAAALGLLLGLKLVGPAASGAQLTPLAAGLAAIVGRLIHDGLHVAFVVLQLPDHPFLREPVYQLILSFLDPLPHAAVAAATVALPLAAAWRADAGRLGPILPPGARAPEARVARAAFAFRSRVAGTAFAAALAASGGALLASAGRGEQPYDPAPEPVVDDGRGSVVVRLERGVDGRMRKFVWTGGGHAVTFFVVPRPDGTLGAALDRCEVCQPKGYAQLGAAYVLCKHCRTPIPVATVGQRGGCNPIPLPSARVEGGVLRIATADLLSPSGPAPAEAR
jgi:hypothetical protein